MRAVGSVATRPRAADPGPGDHPPGPSAEGEERRHTMIYVSRYVGADPADGRHGHGLPVAMELIGPFPHRTRASDWATDPANNPGHDPRWTLVVCTDGNLPTTVRTIPAPPTPADKVREALHQINLLVSRPLTVSVQECIRLILAVREQVDVARSALAISEIK